jgi:ABC-type Na+ efflux pump permease subunit
MTAYWAAPEEGGLEALFESSPDLGVHTSAAAEMAFLLGLVAAVSAPFSELHAVALVTGAVAFLLGLVGVARASRPNVAGTALSPFGLSLAVVALVTVGLRYLGLDTAYGDDALPTLRSWLDALNAVLPRP